MEAQAMDRAALLAALRLQIEWGADEALAEGPVDRATAQAALAAAEEDWLALAERAEG
jgi:hypothetical protein